MMFSGRGFFQIPASSFAPMFRSWNTVTILRQDEEDKQDHLSIVIGHFSFVTGPTVALEPQPRKTCQHHGAASHRGIFPMNPTRFTSLDLP